MGGIFQGEPPSGAGGAINVSPADGVTVNVDVAPADPGVTEVWSNPQVTPLLTVQVKSTAESQELLTESMLTVKVVAVPFGVV